MLGLGRDNGGKHKSTKRTKKALYRPASTKMRHNQQNSYIASIYPSHLHSPRVNHTDLLFHYSENPFPLRDSCHDGFPTWLLHPRNPGRRSVRGDASHSPSAFATASDTTSPPTSSAPSPTARPAATGVAAAATSPSANFKCAQKRLRTDTLRGPKGRLTEGDVDEIGRVVLRKGSSGLTLSYQELLQAGGDREERELGYNPACSADPVVEEVHRSDSPGLFRAGCNRNCLLADYPAEPRAPAGRAERGLGGHHSTRELVSMPGGMRMVSGMASWRSLFHWTAMSWSGL